MTSPEHLIARLHTITSRAEMSRAEIQTESTAIELEWAELGRLGAQRADHAAALLARLLPAIGRQIAFLQTCRDQITQCVQNPFGAEVPA